MSKAMNSGDFYTNVAVSGSSILLRGISDGKRIQERVDYLPSFYIPSNKPPTADSWKTIHGECVEVIRPGSISECREFLRKYEGVSGFRVYGNTNYVYQFIADNYPGHIDFDLQQMKIVRLDIETETEHGFPSIDDPSERINVITIREGNTYHVFGLGTFNVSKPGFVVEAHEFDSEEELLQAFLECWKQIDPDIVTGWNIRFFDIPYLLGRITRVIDEKHAKKLSPWNQVKLKKIAKWNQEYTIAEIVGVSILDTLEVYRRYTFVNLESYKLDFVAELELKRKKIDWKDEGYTSFKDFYTRNFTRFVEYNMIDVELVIDIENKLNLLELHCYLTYLCKVNHEDVFFQVRCWDAIIFNDLKDRRICIPMKEESEERDEQYAGAYVKEPLVGRHDWVVSFDLNSLYPSLIRQYNISPDMIVNDPPSECKQLGNAVTVDSILSKSHDTGCLHTHDLAMAANGQFFRRKDQGFLSRLMESMYNDRKAAKKQMLIHQKELQTASDSDTKKNLELLISKFSTREKALKVSLNSAYGATGNPYFRYYDIRIAEAITLSGQLAIRWIGEAMNAFLNKLTNTKDVDFIIASDTDSLYLRLNLIVDLAFRGKTPTKQEVVAFLDKTCNEVLQPFIDKSYQKLADYTNSREQQMVMKRESIADRGIWTAKKRYILNVYNSEGVDYPEPKLKIMGIETTRSSTPKVCREELKTAIKLILTKTEDEVLDFIETFHTKYMKLTPEQIAFPRSVNGLDRYADEKRIYKSGTPIAVKGALVYNDVLRKKNLTSKYELIREGSKVKFVYLKSPNIVQDMVISFPSTLPTEIGLIKSVDYDTMFDKSFLEPLKHILEVIGWKSRRTGNLESFFA